MQTVTQTQVPQAMPMTSQSFAEAFARTKVSMFSQTSRLVRLLADAGMIDGQEIERAQAALEVAKHSQAERTEREQQVHALRGLGFALGSASPMLDLQAARKHLLDRGEGDPLANISARHREEMAKVAWHMRAEAFMLACYARLKGANAAQELLRELPLMEKSNPGLMGHLMQPVRAAAQEALSAGVIEQCNNRQKLGELITACVAAGVKTGFATDRMQQMQAQKQPAVAARPVEPAVSVNWREDEDDEDGDRPRYERMR